MFLIESREASRSTGQVVDMAQVEAAIRELKVVLDRQSITKPGEQQEISRLDREQVIDKAYMRKPLRSALDHAALESRIERFVTALEAAVERLERLSDGEHRSARLVEMMEGMASIPRVPTRWQEVTRLANLYQRAGQELAYLSPTEIVQRLGSPIDIKADPALGTVTWGYSVPGASNGVRIVFFGNRVIEAEGW